MDETELAAKIDHTVLGPDTRWEDVRRVMDEAADYGMNACIPPCYVADADEYAPEVTLATVVGFPHGHHRPEVKRREAELAAEDGADELDVVLNVGRLLSGDDALVREDLEAVVEATPLPVKVILETALLDDDQKRRACELAAEADADYVKTSTGFEDGGATLHDVELMSDYGPKVKASGGIGSYTKAERMLDAGADRIGASSGVDIVEDFRAL